MLHLDFATEENADWFIAQIAASDTAKTLHREDGRTYFLVSFPNEIAGVVQEWCRRLEGRKPGTHTEGGQKGDTSGAQLLA